MDSDRKDLEKRKQALQHISAQPIALYRSANAIGEPTLGFLIDMALIEANERLRSKF